MRRTTESDAFSAPRMRTPLEPSRNSKSLHRTVSTSDAPSCHPQARPSRSPKPPDALLVTRSLRRMSRDSTCESRIPCRPAGEGLTTGNPRAPSVVSRVCKPKPAGRSQGNFEKATLSSRTVSPSLHPCSASGGATGFLLASALSLHEALRPPGAEDARCVQPTSATQTNCVHPHLACSRLAPRLSPRGRPTESKAPHGMTGGSDVSRRPNRFGRSTSNTLCLAPFASRLLVTSVGVFFPRRPMRSSL